MRKLIFMLFIVFSCASHAQVKDTILIDNVEYLVIIDTITHQVREHYIIER
jgi:hypothetical protein